MHISPFSLSFLLCIVYFVKCIKTLIIPSDICRIVNGLLKTALGPPSGSTTTLSPVQDITFRHESVKCLVNIIKSMGTWMDKQRLGDSYLPKTNESDTSAEKTENHLTLNTEEGAALDNEIHPEGNSDAATLEQRRAFKIELQVELCFTCMGTHFLYCYILLIYMRNSYKCKSVRPFMLYDFHGSFSHHLIGIWAKSLSFLVFYFFGFVVLDFPGISLALPLVTSLLISMQKGISLFNRKPSKGIEFLISTKKIGGSPADVASFLKNNTTSLNETMIGDYLGEREEFSLKVMHAYVDSFNFKEMNFGEAIRFFLRGFKLPGEAQKIDRIMEKFAERYCKCSPNSFTSADTAYVLAYSVIMLNTDAHNIMVKDKVCCITCTFLFDLKQ